MKLFLDTASLKEIEEIASWGVLDGVTTNPSLMAKETGADFKETITAIAGLVDGPISAEVISLDTEGMLKEADDIVTWHENITIKLPTTENGLRAMSILSKQGVKTNATLIFSETQALLAARAGATFVSPFIGRIDDMGGNGIDVLSEIVSTFEIHNITTEVISASIRHQRHVIDSALVGANIATIPYAVMKKMIKHPLTDKGIEAFMSDWNKRV